MLNWRLDANGVPQEILFRVAVESPTSILAGKSDDRVNHEYRFWSSQAWQVYREDGQDAVLADEGPNKIGLVPVVPLYHRKRAPFRGESMLKTAAKYATLLSNWLSSADTVLEKQSFSQAVLKSKSKPSEVGVGTDIVLHLNPGGKDEGQEDFYYASPSADPLAAQWDAFTRVFRLANKSMGLDIDLEEPKVGAESGAARAWKFDELQRRLTAMTENEQVAVRNVLDMAARWKGQDSFPGSVMYSGKYDLGAVENDIERMIAMQAAGLPPTARRELMKSALKKTLPALPADVQAKIDRELETVPGVAVTE